MEILNVYTPEQLTELARQQVIADGVGITDFNEGSVALSIIEAVAAITSTTSFDQLNAFRKAVPALFYAGLGFALKGPHISNGFFRMFRLPQITLEYISSGLSATISISPTQLTTSVTGGPGGEDLTLSFATYPTIADLVTAINTHPSGAYAAIRVGLETTSTLNLYQYVAKELVGTVNYLNQSGIDLMTSGDVLVVIPLGVTVTLGDLQFQTTVAGSIPAGEASSEAIAANSLLLNAESNIIAAAVDTLNGKGSMNNPPPGVQHIINDSVFANGSNGETETERAERYSISIQGLNGGTPRGIEAAVLKLDFVRSVKVLSNVPQRGTITVVADDGSGNLSVEQTDEIKIVLDGNPDDLVNFPGVVDAGIATNIQAPNVTPVNVTLSVTRIGQTSDGNEIKNAVKSALENYINTRRLGEDVILNQLVAIAIKAHPEVTDVSVSLPLSNVSIGSTYVARTGSGTGGLVTVTLVTLTEPP